MIYFILLLASLKVKVHSLSLRRSDGKQHLKLGWSNILKWSSWLVYRVRMRELKVYSTKNQHKAGLRGWAGAGRSTARAEQISGRFMGAYLSRDHKWLCTLTNWALFSLFPSQHSSFLSSLITTHKLSHPQLFLLLLLLSSGPPVGVVDRGVLQEGREHEDKAHDQVDVDGLDVRYPWKRRPDTRTDGGHGEHRGDTCNRARLVIICISDQINGTLLSKWHQYSVMANIDTIFLSAIIRPKSWPLYPSPMSVLACWHTNLTTMLYYSPILQSTQY